MSESPAYSISLTHGGLGFVYSLLHLMLNLFDSGLNLTTVGSDIVAQVIIIDFLSTLRRGVEHVDKKSKLQEEVEGDQPKDDRAELIHDLEETEDNPVGKP